MKPRIVLFSPEAGNDLLKLYERIASAAGERVAMGYLERVEEKRITVAFLADEAQVTILRLFSKGQDWESALP